jgi:hypothetical protein
MNDMQGGRQVYICPMHSEVREKGPGKCPHCGMELLPEGTRFGMVRHMMSSPMPFIVMGAVMVVLMIVTVMWR